jgi:hypothetical protein
MPSVERFPVSAEFGGLQYIGEQHVEGQRHRYQSVTYEGRTKKDPYRYRQDESEYMNLMAKGLLLELVRESIT